MFITEKINKDKRVQDYYHAYMAHPFIKGIEEGTLDRNKFKNYLIQDSLYLKDYGKVYASIFMDLDRIEDLQFMHICIGVVVSDETTMHSQYLMDYGLDVYKVDNAPIEKENRAYLDYMLSFTKGDDIKKTFMAALPCTLTYEYIGKTLFNRTKDNSESHYFSPWIEAYSGRSFEEFSVKSCELINRLCKDCSEKEQEELIDIYVEACRHEMKFWDMSFR